MSGLSHDLIGDSSSNESNSKQIVGEGLTGKLLANEAGTHTVIFGRLLVGQHVTTVDTELIMSKKSDRNDFSPSTKEAIAKRAAYICSNPGCRRLTLSPSESESNKFVYTGKAAHITAAAPGGPRYDPGLTSEERSSTKNAIFLCSTCADMIDKNQGIDYPVGLLKQWKREHEEWLAANRHKTILGTPELTMVDGTHYAAGVGDITGIDVQGPVIFRPGTKSTAAGIGNVTATRIDSSKESDQ
jgi:hypothetical protein